MFEVFGTAAIAISIGIGLVALVWFLTRRALRLRPELQASIDSRSQSNELPEHGNAVLQILSGGRVDYVNTIGRSWFGLLDGEEPNLERLARRARPSDAFWGLCVSEGQARFSLGGRLVEGVSYQVSGKEGFTRRPNW